MDPPTPCFSHKHLMEGRCVEEGLPASWLGGSFRGTPLVGMESSPSDFAVLSVSYWHFALEGVESGTPCLILGFL